MNKVWKKGKGYWQVRGLAVNSA